MNTSTDKHELIYKFLDGTASKEEREELDQWLTTSEANRLEFNDIKLLFDNTIEADLPNDWEGSFVPIRNIINSRVRRDKAIRFGIRILAFAGCLSAVYLISYLISKRGWPF